MKCFNCKIYEYDEGCDLNYCQCLDITKNSSHYSVNVFGSKRVQRARRALEVGKQIRAISKRMSKERIKKILYKIMLNPIFFMSVEIHI